MGTAVRMSARTEKTEKPAMPDAPPPTKKLHRPKQKANKAKEISLWVLLDLTKTSIPRDRFIKPTTKREIEANEFEKKIINYLLFN